MNLLQRVGVDVDGVLADVLTLLFQHANTAYGLNLSPAAMTGWDIEPLLPQDVDVEEFWRGFCRSTEGHHDFAVLPGAVEGLNLLRTVADVYVVTAYLPVATTWAHDRDRWLHHHFNIPHKRIIHTHAKYVFSGAALIDDKPLNIEQWIEEHPRGFGVLWAQPYNASCSIARHPRVVRTADWQTVANIFSGGALPSPTRSVS